MIKCFINDYKFSEFSRYSLVGLLCALLDIVFLYIFVEYLHFWYLLATTISFSSITYLGYFVQKKFTFRNKSKNHNKQFFLFSFVSITGLIANTILMYLFVSILGIWYILSNIITKIIILFWNFFANKYITFNNRNE